MPYYLHEESVHNGTSRALETQACRCSRILATAMIKAVCVLLHYIPGPMSTNRLHRPTSKIHRVASSSASPAGAMKIPDVIRI